MVTQNSQGGMPPRASRRQTLKASEAPVKRPARARLTAGEFARRPLSLLIVVCLLAAPALAVGGKGQKNFKQGLAHESAQQWERAAEEFALAAAAEPSNV